MPPHRADRTACSHRIAANDGISRGEGKVRNASGHHRWFRSLRFHASWCARQNDSSWRLHLPFSSAISSSSFANREREQIVFTDRTKSVREMDAYDAYRLADEIPCYRSKIPCSSNISLLVCVGNYAKSDCGAAVSCNKIGLGSPEIAEFPVLFPVSRELPPQTGSYLTASATTQSPGLKLLSAYSHL